MALQKKRYSALVLSGNDLYTTLVEGALKYFDINGVKVKLSERCEYIHIEKDIIMYAETSSGRKIASDYFVLALPFYYFKKIFSEKYFRLFFPKFAELESSTVISVHIFFSDNLPVDMIPFNESGMLGVIDCNIQWIFKKAPHIISLTISAADYIEKLKDKTNQDIYELCITDLNKLFAGIGKYEIKKYKVIKEKRATFVSDFDSGSRRIEQKSRIKNMYIVGDWVNTRLPSTIESAIKSSKTMSEIIES